MNVIDPDYTVTGMGVCTRGTMNRWLTQAQTFIYVWRMVHECCQSDDGC